MFKSGNPACIKQAQSINYLKKSLHYKVQGHKTPYPITGITGFKG